MKNELRDRVAGVWVGRFFSRRILFVVAMVVMGGAVLPVVGEGEGGGAGGGGEYRQVLMGLRGKAVEQVVASSKSEDAYLRANAMEAAEYLGDRALPMLQLGMEDGHAVVRFAALVTAGKLRLVDLSSRARGLLLWDKSASVRCAAMFALERCGEAVDISGLSTMLVSQDPGVRGNAAMVVGWLGDKSAVPMLRAAARSPMARASVVREAIVRLQVAEAIARLGDESVLDAIRAGMYSQFDEVRVLAVTMMGGLGDRRFEKGIGELLAGPPVELQLAAGEALGRFGRDDGLKAALEASGSPVGTVAAQAAGVLGWIRDRRAGEALGGLLGSGSEQVRLSAAGAILKALAGGPGGVWREE